MGALMVASPTDTGRTTSNSTTTNRPTRQSICASWPTSSCDGMTMNSTDSNTTVRFS